MTIPSIIRLSAVLACGLLVAPLTASAQYGRGHDHDRLSDHGRRPTYGRSNDHGREIDRLESLGAAIEKDGARLYHEIRREVDDRHIRGEMLADAQTVYNSGKRIQELAHHGRIHSVHREGTAMERSLKRLDDHAHRLSRHVTAYRHGDHLHAEHSHAVDARQIQRLVHQLDQSRERLDDFVHHLDDHRAPVRRPVQSSPGGIRIGGPGFNIQFGR